MDSMSIVHLTVLKKELANLRHLDPLWKSDKAIITDWLEYRIKELREGRAPP